MRVAASAVTCCTVIQPAIALSNRVWHASITSRVSLVIFLAFLCGMSIGVLAEGAGVLFVSITLLCGMAVGVLAGGAAFFLVSIVFLRGMAVGVLAGGHASDVKI